jgi:hypothetical protein
VFAIPAGTILLILLIKVTGCGALAIRARLVILNAAKKSLLKWLKNK